MLREIDIHFEVEKVELLGKEANEDDISIDFSYDYKDYKECAELSQENSPTVR